MKRACAALAPAWFSRAALSAVDLHEQQEQWSAAVAILRRMAREDVPGRAEAADRAQRLQRDHPEANATALPSPLPTSLP